ncbi:MAG TPA: hypothetical protein VJP40_04270 [bacterium]|nr:hypothetical protein [bacterium]
MNRFRFLAWSFSLSLAILPLGSALASSEVEDLRREVRELRQTVRQLSEAVKQQNQRIETLTGAPPSAPASTVAEPAVPKPKSPEPIATAPSGSDPEIEGLLDQVNQAPTPPGTNSRSIGLWRYPTPGGTAAKLLPDISAFGSFAFAYFSEDPTFEAGHDPARTGFTLQEIELAIQSAIDPYVRGDIFLAFHEEGVELEEAYMTTLGAGLPRGLQFKGGKFLLPFGRQNLKHLHSWAFVDNNLVNRYLLGPEGLSELGVEASYLFPIPSFLQLQGTFTNGDNETSFNGGRKQDFLYNGRLAGSVDVTPNLTVLAGASGAFGFNSAGAGTSTELYGGDLLLRWKPSASTGLTWQTEYILRRMEFPGGGVQSDGGLYSYLDWQFFKRWHAGIRYDQMGIPEGIIPNQYRISPALTFEPTEFSRIRLQYEYDKTANFDGVHAAMFQFQFSMGPHAAHPY